jgi:hypothetical protein
MGDIVPFIKTAVVDEESLINKFRFKITSLDDELSIVCGKNSKIIKDIRNNKFYREKYSSLYEVAEEMDTLVKRYQKILSDHIEEDDTYGITLSTVISSKELKKYLKR